MLSRPQKNIIDLFKTALVNKNAFDIKVLWDAHAWLALWASENPVNLGDETAPDFCTITLKEGVEIFRQSLICGTLYVIEAQRTTSVMRWLGGHEVNFGTSEVPDLRKQTFSELLRFYAACLPRYSIAELFGLCLDVRPEFTRDLYRGYTKNIGSQTAPDLFQLSRDQIKQHFLAGLENRRIDIVNSIWQSHAWMKSWVRGAKVNLAHASQESFPRLDINDVITLFESALGCKATEVIREIWYSDDLLRDWALMRANASETASLPVMTMERAIHYHRKVIACQLPTISEAFLHSEKIGKQLQLLYSGVPIKLSEDKEAKEISISRRDRIKFFEVSSMAKDKPLVKSIYLSNWWLGEWLRGRLILEPDSLSDNQLIADDELLRIFRSIILSESRSVQYSVLYNNQRLADLVSRLHENDYISLLQSVMTSQKDTVSDFMKLFVKSSTRVTALRFVQRQMDDANSPHFILLDDQCQAITQNLLPVPKAQEEKAMTVRSTTPPTAVGEIAQFKMVLNMHPTAGVLKFWHENPVLKDKIKALSSVESVKLLKNVMCSSSLGKGAFITLYLDFMQDKDVVHTVLKQILNSKADQTGYYTINRIEVLKRRYDDLCKAEKATRLKHPREEPEERRQRIKLSDPIVPIIPIVPIEIQRVSDEELLITEDSEASSSPSLSASTNSSLTSTGHVQNLLGMLPLKGTEFEENGYMTSVEIVRMPDENSSFVPNFNLFSHSVNYAPTASLMPPSQELSDVFENDNYNNLSPWTSTLG